MKRSIARVCLVLGLAMAVPTAASPPATFGPCAPDAVRAGTVCLDRYEASVWRVPDPTTANASLVAAIQQGKATRAGLTAGGSTQLGTASNDYEPCTGSGQNCTGDVYAVSLPSEIPAAFVTWFQAQEACANSGKRLPTSAEWQVGANGTPDPGPDNGTTDCNSRANSVSLTGARTRCVSARGAFDMVGNLDEWVADWVPLSTECSDWGGFGDDLMCLFGASAAPGGPGALLRGGDFRLGSSAGPLAVVATGGPSSSRVFVGFRCAAERVPIDDCPFFESPDQTDTDGDGRGDACECTDQDGDGRNTVSDLIAINAAIFDPARATPLCDGNDDGLCNVNDIIAANLEIFSPGNTSTCARQPVPGP